MSDEQIWDSTIEQWDTDDYIWNWASTVIPELNAAIDSGRLHQRNLNKQVKNLSKKDEAKFITILTKVSGTSYKKQKRVKKTAITIEDVKFLIKEMKNIEVKVLKD
jgi:hypothetical protein